MYFLKCKPEKVEETVQDARVLFAGGSVVVDKVQMSEASWVGMFGEGRLKHTEDLSGVPVELTGSGKMAIIVLGTNEPVPATKAAKAKKAKK